MQMERERWKWIKGYEGKYKVSNYGRVKSFISSPRKIIKPTKHYASISYVLRNPEFSNNQQRVIAKVIVYEAFVGDIPPRERIEHVDGNTENLFYKNLRIKIITNESKIRRRIRHNKLAEKLEKL